jgi:hypothetical protein
MEGDKAVILAQVPGFEVSRCEKCSSEPDACHGEHVGDNIRCKRKRDVGEDRRRYSARARIACKELTPRDLLAQEKTHFSTYLSSQVEFMGDKKVECLKYIAMVEAMSIENFIDQVNTLIRPFVRWGQTNIAVTWVLYNVGISEKISARQFQHVGEFFRRFCSKLQSFNM